MKIFLLTNLDTKGYDTFDSCVVCAESVEDAKSINPDGNDFKEDKSWYNSWAFTKKGIDCKEIGDANKKQTRGVICASYNAG